MSDRRGRFSGMGNRVRFMPEIGNNRSGRMSNRIQFGDRDRDCDRDRDRDRDRCRCRCRCRNRDAAAASAELVLPRSDFSPLRLPTYESFYPNEVIRPNPVKPRERNPDDMDIDSYPPEGFYPSPEEGPEFDYLPPLRGPKIDYHSLPLGCVPTNDPDCDFVCLPPGFIRPGQGVPLPDLIPFGGPGTSDFWKHQWDIFKGPPGPDDCIIFM